MEGPNEAHPDPRAAVQGREVGWTLLPAGEGASGKPRVHVTDGIRRQGYVQVSRFS